MLLVYSSDNGWTELVSSVSQEILKAVPRGFVDCRSAGSMTGEMEIYLVRRGQRELVFSGTKHEI